jgi:hypothetical protein
VHISKGPDGYGLSLAFGFGAGTGSPAASTGPPGTPGINPTPSIPGLMSINGVGVQNADYFFTDRIFWQDVLNRAVFILTPGYAASVEMERAFWEGRYVHAAEWLVVGLGEMFVAALSGGSSQTVNAYVRGVFLGSNLVGRVAATAANRGVTVLGHHPGYIQYAERIGARYFKTIPQDIAERMGREGLRAANTRFLDRLIARGDIVELSTPAALARAGSTFAWELQYLQSHGYRLTVDGMRMLPPGL